MLRAAFRSPVCQTLETVDSSSAWTSLFLSCARSSKADPVSKLYVTIRSNNNRKTMKWLHGGRCWSNPPASTLPSCPCGSIVWASHSLPRGPSTEECVLHSNILGHPPRPYQTSSLCPKDNSPPSFARRRLNSLVQVFGGGVCEPRCVWASVHVSSPPWPCELPDCRLPSPSWGVACPPHPLPPMSCCWEIR